MEGNTGAGRKPALGWPGRALAGLALAAQAGCLDLALLADAAFPAEVPGLPAEAGWASLPVGSWLTEGGVQAQAISACLSCPEPAAAAVFKARGAAATQLGRDLDDPARFSRALARRAGERPKREGAAASSPPSVAASREAGLSGFTVRLARSDGTRQAVGLVLARRSPGEITALMVIAADDAVARRLARGIAPNLL